MSKTLEQVQTLAARGEVVVSLHGYEQLAADGIRVRDALTGLQDAVVVERLSDVSERALRTRPRVR